MDKALASRLIAVHESLAGAGIPHAFGGAIALAFWTLDPRGTSDIDVNIFVSENDYRTALDALPPEIEATPQMSAELAREGQTRLWWDRTPVDVFLNNLEIHRRAEERRQYVTFFGVRIPILSAVDLAVFKVMFNRTKDWADVEAMITASMLDVDLLRNQLVPMLPPDAPQFARLAEAVRLGVAEREE